MTQLHEETIVTKLHVRQPSKKEFCDWQAKLNRSIASFPGFRGMFIQAPTGVNRNWLTFLQFDSVENMDNWLSSKGRQEVLDQSKDLIKYIESHRVISPYAGWFASITKAAVEAPPVWKQTMIVLLVLFPIVMFELKYLSPLTANLNPSLATFIGNAISVSLVSWPFVPIAIWFLGFWLVPKNEKHRRVTIIGTCLVLLPYAIEIAALWNLL